MKKSQTATEYLIILAVVIVIALIVVGVLGGIPGIGTGTSERQKKITELSNDIGIASYAVYDCGTKLTLRNNNPFTVQITGAMVNNTACSSSDLPASLAVGESVQITCADICGDLGSRYSYYVNVTWKQVSSGGGTEFTQAGGKIEGIVGINTTGSVASSDQDSEEEDNSSGTSFSTCQTISAGGAYYLSQDISTSSNCLDISASNVAIYGNNHAITGGNTAGDFNGPDGIIISGDNVTIQDLSLQEFSIAVSISGDNVIVNRVNVQASSMGINIAGATGTIITNSTMTDIYSPNGGYYGVGIRAYQNTANTQILYNTISNCNGMGINLRDNAAFTLTGNNLSNNGNYGIFGENGGSAILTDNSVCSTSGLDYYCTPSSFSMSGSGNMGEYDSCGLSLWNNCP